MKGNMINKNKGVFLDRDGVINIDKGYVHKWEEFEIYEGVEDALNIFLELGYKLIIITNQSGIDRKIFKLKDYETLTNKYVDYFKKKVFFLMEFIIAHIIPYSQKINLKTVLAENRIQVYL